MFQRQYPTDSYIYVELARRIDYVFRTQIKQTPCTFILKYKKEHPECRLPEKLIYFLVTRRWTMVKAYPRFQTLNEICKLIGLEIWDFFLFADPDEMLKQKKVKHPTWKVQKHKKLTYNPDHKFGI